MRAVAVLAVVASLPGVAHAAEQSFDLARAMARGDRGVRAIVRRLAGEGLEGRDNGTPASDRAQELLIRKLRRIGAGANPAGSGDEAYRQPFVEGGQAGTNLLAVIRGRELPDEYVIVGAHYDHLDSRSVTSGACSTGYAPGGAVCPGATDNAAGAGVVLGVGRALAKLPVPPRRSVVLALWDAEEDGLLGSLHYVLNPLVPLARTVAYVNLDIQGANLLPSLRRTSFAVGAETGGSALGAFVADAVAAANLDTLPVSYIFGQRRSDYANFVERGRVPTVFFSDSTGGCYHTTGDRWRVVDRRKLAAQTRIALHVTARLAESAAPPAFRAPSPALATFADARAIHRVFSRAQDDLALFPPPDRALLEQIRRDLGAVVDAGPAGFGPAQVGVVLNAALQGIGALTRLPCDGFQARR